MFRMIIPWVRRHAAEIAILVFIMLVGTILRTYHVGSWMHFGSDEGRTAFAVRQIVHDHRLVFLGPTAQNNRPDFHLGPLFFYLLAPFYVFSGLSPAGGAWAIALGSIISIIILYLLGRRLFGPVAGLVAAALSSVSFLMVYYGRWAWNPNLVPLFALLIMLFLWQLATASAERHRGHYLYLVAACFGAIIQLHGTALLLLPIIIGVYLLIVRPKVWWYRWLMAIAIVVIVNAPLIARDLTHGFANTKAFYRVITQQDSSHVVPWSERIDRALTAWQNFLHEALLHQHLRLAFFVVLICLVAFLIYVLITNIRRRQWHGPGVLIALWIGVPFAAFFTYKEQIPAHYFCLLFPVPYLLLGAAVSWMWRFRKARLVVCVAVMALVGWQGTYSYGLLRDLEPNGSRASSYPVTLEEMQSAVEYIITNSAGQPFSFESIPAGSYDESYRYLFTLHSSMPVAAGPTAYPYRVVAPNAELPPEASGNASSMQQFGQLRVYRQHLP